MARLRDEVPADHRAGRGKGPRGHGLLHVQQAHLLERGGRKPGQVRHVRRGIPRAQPEAAEVLAPCPDNDIHPRFEAQRRRPGKDKRPLRDAGGVEEGASRDGASSTGRSASPSTAATRPMRTRSISYTRRSSAHGRINAGEAEYRDFVERIKEYMLKAIREAKVNTSWVNPRPAYEEASAAFVEAVLDRGRPNEFLDDFEAFHRRIAFCGMCNSLSQTLLKIMSPGVPDFYQGTEVWSLRLVDPDNRGPVDYGALCGCSTSCAGGRRRRPSNEIAAQLAGAWEDGRIKMYVTSKALDFRRRLGPSLAGPATCPCRRQAPGRPMSARSPAGRGARLHRGRPPPRRRPRRRGKGAAGIREGRVGRRFLLVPTLHSPCYENVFTGEIVKRVRCGDAHALRLADLFRTFPVALLAGIEPGRERGMEKER